MSRRCRPRTGYERAPRRVPRYRTRLTATHFDATVSQTDRRRKPNGETKTALQLAYFSSYFEQPRSSTGEELADNIGVTKQTFHYHLRNAEETVFEILFEEPEDPSSDESDGDTFQQSRLAYMAGSVWDDESWNSRQFNVENCSPTVAVIKTVSQATGKCPTDLSRSRITPNRKHSISYSGPPKR
ncbi:hypothetical protein D8S78_16140 [Natrialba swarupiae]|nr:hypothetical protein [Natrialba swarupiae]